jgi:hypothetical protein
LKIKIIMGSYSKTTTTRPDGTTTSNWDIIFCTIFKHFSIEVSSEEIDEYDSTIL